MDQVSLAEGHYPHPPLPSLVRELLVNVDESLSLSELLAIYTKLDDSR